LNYILHYPKLEKYISLFPTSAEADERDSDDAESSNRATDVVTDATSVRRQELRRIIKERMESGEVSSEPEVAVENGEARADTSKQSRDQPPTRVENSSTAPKENNKKSATENKSTTTNAKKNAERLETAKSTAKSKSKEDDIRHDDFFDVGNDDDSAEEASGSE